MTEKILQKKLLQDHAFLNLAQQEIDLAMNLHSDAGEEDTYVYESPYFLMVVGVLAAIMSLYCIFHIVPNIRREKSFKNLQGMTKEERQ